MHTCAWCGTSYASWRSSCESCGGALPQPPGEDPGPAPPEPPRTLPPSYIRRIKYTTNVIFLVGAGFGCIGIPMGLLFLAIGLGSGEGAMAAVGAVVLAIFGGLGVGLGRWGWSKAAGIINALERGRATRGKITSVYHDTSVQINGRSPWAIEYRFEAAGKGFEGKVQTWDGEQAERKPGQPVHVVYVESAPEQNALYPPVK
jgi:hypothetical protein